MWYNRSMLISCLLVGLETFNRHLLAALGSTTAHKFQFWPELRTFSTLLFVMNAFQGATFDVEVSKPF